MLASSVVNLGPPCLWESPVALCAVVANEAIDGPAAAPPMRVSAHRVPALARIGRCRTIANNPWTTSTLMTFLDNHDDVQRTDTVGALVVSVGINQGDAVSLPAVETGLTTVDSHRVPCAPMIASMTTSISSTNIQDMEVRGREIVQALFGHILNSNVRALELFVSGDTDGSGELDFHEFGSALNMMNVTIVSRIGISPAARRPPQWPCRWVILTGCPLPPPLQHPADLELAFYTLDEEDEGTLLIADIMDQYRAQAKVWKANRMKGGIGKWPNRNKMLESEDWEAAGKKDWEAAAARASVAKLGQANLYDIDSDDEEDAERLTAGHINRQVYFQEVRQAEEAEAMAVQEAEQAAQAQESFDKEEAEAVVAEQAAAKEEAEAQAAVAIANIEEAEARAALEEARAEEAAALAAEKVAIATREKHAEAVSDAEREKKEADEAREAVEEAKAKLNSAVRNTKDSDGAGFWVEIDDATSGMQAQLARELEEAEARLDKEQREADEATVVATQRLEQEEAAAEVARSARAVAEVAKLKAADEQAEAEAAKLVAERELSDFYHARDTATKERCVPCCFRSPSRCQAARGGRLAKLREDLSHKHRAQQD